MANHFRPEFILAYGCLGAVSFEERVRSAAGAGFTKIGYSVLEFQSLARAGMTLTELRATLDNYGIEIAELEIALGFDAGFHKPGAGAPPRWGPASFPFDVPSYDPATHDALFAMVEALRPAHVNIAGTWGLAEQPNAATHLAELCDLAARYDTTVAVEFMPGTSVPDLSSTAALLAAADRTNAGVCFDTWHFVRGSNSDGAAPHQMPDQIAVIQIADGSADPVVEDYFAETMHLRRLPGDGEWDLPKILRKMVTSGVRAPWSIEVISDEVRSMPPGAAAARLHDSLTSLAAQVFISTPGPTAGD